MKTSLDKYTTGNFLNSLGIQIYQNSEELKNIYVYQGHYLDEHGNLFKKNINFAIVYAMTNEIILPKDYELEKLNNYELNSFNRLMELLDVPSCKYTRKIKSVDYNENTGWNYEDN